MTTEFPTSRIDFARILACAALSPDPCGMLVFEASPREAISISSTFKQMIEVTTGLQLSPVIQLGVSESEDDLWGVLSLEVADTTELKSWHRPGLLTRLLEQDRPGLIIIPDLSRISLATKRAILTTLGAPKVYFERHGLHKAQSVNLYWLAACPYPAIDSVSRHLLDRFTYRAVKPRELAEDRNSELSKRVATTNSFKAEPESLPSLLHSLKVFLSLLNEAKTNSPSYTPEAISRILDFFEDQKDYHTRRQISLARVARSLAQLAGKGQVTPDDIDEAANLTGLSTSTPQPSHLTHGLPDHLTSPKREGAASIVLNKIADVEVETESIKEFPADQLWENVAHAPLASHYPEDDLLPQREFAELRYPITSRSKRSHERGLIIGIERATNLVDLSVIATILEASKYRQIRRKNSPHLRGSLNITVADLRKHRRSYKPDRMLVLMLDHTCVRNRGEHEIAQIEANEDALVTHLRWAYFEKASVTIIQVGRSEASNELRAERVSAETVIDPRIESALKIKSGKATPLAHGLSLAHETLRRSLWQGRGQPQHVRLVIFTDGRGNVPLAASLTGEIRPPTHSAGISDSLEQARKIRNFTQSEGLRRVEAYFLTPQSKVVYGQNQQPRYGSQDVRVRLAEELNAKLFLIIPSEMEA